MGHTASRQVSSGHLPPRRAQTQRRILITTGSTGQRSEPKPRRSRAGVRAVHPRQRGLRLLRCLSDESARAQSEGLHPSSTPVKGASVTEEGTAAPAQGSPLDKSVTNFVSQSKFQDPKSLWNQK